MFYELLLTTEKCLREMTNKFRKLFSEAGITLDKIIIIYEDNLNTRYGGSCRGYFQLSYMGHQDIGILDGGLAVCSELELNPEYDIIIYCFKGARASNTFIALKMAGFKNIRNYYGF